MAVSSIVQAVSMWRHGPVQTFVHAAKTGKIVRPIMSVPAFRHSGLGQALIVPDGYPEDLRLFCRIQYILGYRLHRRDQQLGVGVICVRLLVDILWLVVQ